MTNTPPTLTARVIPCLDVRDGRVVKGVRFLNLRDAGDPVALAAMYESQGADEIVMLDVSATLEGRRAKLDTVARLRKVLSIPLTVGGGVRDVDDASALLDSGADKVGVNSAAVADPGLIERLAIRFGAQCVVLAIDAARIAGTDDHAPRWRVVVRSGSQSTVLDAIEWAVRGESLGAGEILLTSMDRDGTQSGYDLAQLSAVARAVHVPVIASGGASRAEDLKEALDAGADAVLAASIFHDGHTTVGKVKHALHALGVCVRLDSTEMGASENALPGEAS